MFGDFLGHGFHPNSQDEIAEIALPGFGSFALGFGEDESGRLYVMANDSGVPFEETGVVLRVAGPAEGVLQLAAFLGWMSDP